MYDWLFEGRFVVYFILVGLVLLAIFLYTRVPDQPKESKKPKESRRSRLPSYLRLPRQPEEELEKFEWRWLLLPAAGVFAGLAVVYFLVDLLVETSREQVRRKLTEMAAAVSHRDVDRIMSHVSDEFHAYDMDKAQFRQYLEGLLRQNLLEEVVVWNFADEANYSGERVKVTLLTRAKGSKIPDFSGIPIDVEFIHERDRRWRLSRFTVYNPDTGKTLSEMPLLKPSTN
jgi:hypothetical protein